MTHLETIITIILVVFATMLTRFLSFFVFPNSDTMPKFIKYLGTVLPFAVMGLLVVFSFKEVSFLQYPYAVPEIISGTVVLILHIYKRNMLFSIAGGTLLYMFLLQKVFIG